MTSIQLVQSNEVLSRAISRKFTKWDKWGGGEKPQGVSAGGRCLSLLIIVCMLNIEALDVTIVSNSKFEVSDLVIMEKKICLE